MLIQGTCSWLRSLHVHTQQQSGLPTKIPCAQFQVRVVSGNLPILPPSRSPLARSGIKRRVVGQLSQANAYYSIRPIHHSAADMVLTGLPSTDISRLSNIPNRKRSSSDTMAACTAISPSHLAHLYSLKRKADLRFDHLLPGLAVPQSGLGRVWMQWSWLRHNNGDPEPLLIKRKNLSERRHGCC